MFFLVYDLLSTSLKHDDYLPAEPMEVIKCQRCAMLVCLKRSHNIQKQDRKTCRVSNAQINYRQKSGMHKTQIP